VIAAKGGARGDRESLPPERAAEPASWSAASAACRGRTPGTGSRARRVPGSAADNQHEFSFEFLGLVGLADPVAADGPARHQECRSAGIRVVMITGITPAPRRLLPARFGLKPADLCIYRARSWTRWETRSCAIGSGM